MNMKRSGVLGTVFTIIKVLVGLAIFVAAMKWLGLSWNDVTNLINEGITGIKSVLGGLKGINLTQ